MKNSTKLMDLMDIFYSNVSAITDSDLEQDARLIAAKLPQQFWYAPASTSSLYHPPDERGKHGLLIHSLRGHKAAMVLCESRCLKEHLINQVRFAMLFHDCMRLKISPDQPDDIYKMHPLAAVTFIKSVIPKPSKNLRGAIRLIRTHMGPWGDKRPVTNLQWLVHYADNIASKIHDIQAISYPEKILVYGEPGHGHSYSMEAVKDGSLRKMSNK